MGVVASQAPWLSVGRPGAPPAVRLETAPDRPLPVAPAQPSEAETLPEVADDLRLPEPPVAAASEPETEEPASLLPRVEVIAAPAPESVPDPFADAAAVSGIRPPVPVPDRTAAPAAPAPGAPLSEPLPSAPPPLRPAAPSPVPAAAAARPSPAAASAPARPCDGECPPPPYPARARALGWEGEVEVLVSIDAAGRPAAATVRKSSGHSLLDDAALKAVVRWRFHPEVRQGVPQASKLLVPISFRILK